MKTEKFEIGDVITKENYTKAALFCKLKKDRIIEIQNDKYVIVENNNTIKPKDEIFKLEQYLTKTDWYILRFIETKKEIPEEISKKREEARKKISKLKNKIEE